jgi:hypothetical protein
LSWCSHNILCLLLDIVPNLDIDVDLCKRDKS